MPQNEPFWNPYRWVEISERPVEHDRPHYHHCFAGLAGRAECTLTALTPLIIGDGNRQEAKGQKQSVQNVEFVRHGRTGPPYIPATSLKGNIRALAELVGNAAVPFDKCDIDDAHKLASAASNDHALDVVARTFGYLNSGRVFSGLIRFSDGELVSQAAFSKWPEYNVAVGQPKKEHRSFYPDKRRRKLYHHLPNAERLTPPHAGIRQTATVRPAPPGTQFRFTVDFRNLRDDELNLLLYCLVLEDDVTVTLGPEALGPDAREPASFRGPMRHKLGGCKPHGGGSVHIVIDKLLIRTDPADRYRGRDSAQEYVGDRLARELQRRTAAYVKRNDATMQQLRAMMIYSSDDPRRRIEYPTYHWFTEDKERPSEKKTRLKPTL